MAAGATTDPSILQAAALDLNTADPLYYQAIAAGDYVTARIAADRINRDNALLNRGAFLPGPWYSLPTNYSDVPALQLPGGLTYPTASGAVASAPAIAKSTTAKSTAGSAAPLSEGFSPSTDCAYNPTLYCCEFPEDPSCFTDSGGSPVTVPVPVTTNVTNVTNVYETVEGLDQTTVTSLVDGALSSLWSIVVGGVDAAIAAAIAGVQAALTAISNALKQAVQVLASLAGDILSFLKSLWQAILKELVAALKTLVTLLGDLYEKVLKPLIRALANLRAKLLEIYERFIRPLLVIIQDLRRVLAILKLFHVKFAAKLDAALADIQARITQPLFFLLQYTNWLGNWINLIVTAGYLIQRPLWLASFNAYKGSSIALQVNAMSSPLDPGAIAGVQQQNALPPTGQSAASWAAWYMDGTGPYAQSLTTQSEQLELYLYGNL